MAAIFRAGTERAFLWKLYRMYKANFACVDSCFVGTMRSALPVSQSGLAIYHQVTMLPTVQ